MVHKTIQSNNTILDKKNVNSKKEKLIMAKNKKEIKTGVMVKLTEIFKGMFFVLTLSQYKDWLSNEYTVYTMQRNKAGVPKHERGTAAYFVNNWLNSPTTIKQCCIDGLRESKKRENTWGSEKKDIVAHINWLKNEKCFPCYLKDDNTVILPNIDCVTF